MKGGDCRWVVDIAGLASKSSFSFIARLSSASAKDIGSGMVSGTIVLDDTRQTNDVQTLQEHELLILLSGTR